MKSLIWKSFTSLYLFLKAGTHGANGVHVHEPVEEEPGPEPEPADAKAPHVLVEL